MLKLVLPKGSLEKATMELFEAADLPVERSSSAAYKATIADPRIESVADWEKIVNELPPGSPCKLDILVPRGRSFTAYLRVPRN